MNSSLLEDSYELLLLLLVSLYPNNVQVIIIMLCCWDVARTQKVKYRNIHVI